MSAAGASVALTRRYRFSASHRLHSPRLGEQENRETFGKCNHPYGHGHNYVLEVTVAGPVDAITGLVTPLAGLDAVVREAVLAVYDHRDMNRDIDTFQGEVVPTTENVAVDVDRRLRIAWVARFGDGQPALRQVRLLETKNNAFTL